jgi:hypothetical protein
MFWPNLLRTLESFRGYLGSIPANPANVLGKVDPTPANQITVKCPRCDRTFRLNYTDDEWHRVKTWLTIAERALRDDHKGRHETVGRGTPEDLAGRKDANPRWQRELPCH